MKYSYIVVKHIFVDFYMSINLPFKKNEKKCMHTAQIHEYNSNKIYTQYKQYKENTKKTHTYLSHEMFIYLSI